MMLKSRRQGVKLILNGFQLFYLHPCVTSVSQNGYMPNMNAVLSGQQSGVFLTLLSDRKTCHNINVSDGNLLDEVTILGEYLHAGPLIATVTHHVLARMADDSHFAWVPQLTLLTTCSGRQKAPMLCTPFVIHDPGCAHILIT